MSDIVATSGCEQGGAVPMFFDTAELVEYVSRPNVTEADQMKVVAQGFERIMIQEFIKAGNKPMFDNTEAYARGDKGMSGQFKNELQAGIFAQMGPFGMESVLQVSTQTQEEK